MRYQVDWCRWTLTTQGVRLVRYTLPLTLVTMLAILAGPGPVTAQRGKPDVPSASTNQDLLRSAKSWGYQLQEISSAKLDRTPYDVLIVDAGPGDGSSGLTRSQISKLKTKPDGSRRLVIAYINIGEAENYRSYWQKSWTTQPPAWMGSENCRWKGDHRVRHWSPEWQSIVFGQPKSVLGRLIDAGYDGVWLDRVDIFYYWRGERWQAASDMVDFVVSLSAWAKARNPAFLIVPQNGEELLADPRYRRAIDGMGKEDMLFGDRGNERRNAGPRVARAKRNFASAQADGLPVLAVEYTRRKESIAAATNELRSLGFVPYFGPRSLAYIGQEGTPHKEDGDTEPTVADQGDESCG